MDESTISKFPVITDKNLPSSKNLQNIQISKTTELVNQEIDNIFSLKNSPKRNSLPECDLTKESKPIPENVDVIRVCKRRWLIMLVYIFYAFVVSFQWPMYTIIANVITKYYGVSNLTVDFTTVTDYISYFITFLPVGWILNNLGLRWSMLISSFLHALGCILRIFSVASDRFWLSMTGQGIVGLSSVFVVMITNKLAATWFPAHQVSSANALASNGILLGYAAGLLLPPMLVQNSDYLPHIARDLNRLYLGLAVLAFISLLLIALFFQEEPHWPPSQAQRIQRREGALSRESPKEFLGSLKTLVTERTYLALLISYTLNQGVFCVLVTLLNQILIPHFPGREKGIGVVGLLFIVSGIVSAAIFGHVLDRTHAFKKTTAALNLLTLVGWIAFAVLLRYGDIFWIYISTSILGFATIGVQVIGTEFGVEITFPESEALTNGLMIGGLEAWGFVCTLLYGCVLEAWGDDVANAMLTVPIAIACVMSFYLRPTLKRLAAQRTESSLEDNPRSTPRLDEPCHNFTTHL